MIEVKSLRKSYGSRQVLSNLNFKIQPGEIVGFLGPNGAGKTTTMRILTGHTSPHEGEVYICGINIFEKPESAKQRIGYLPESPPIYGDMSVKGYLKYVSQLKNCPRLEIQKTIQSSMESTGLIDVQNRLIRNLSKGFRQRVGLAQALIGSPEVLILDEPTVGLDPKQVIEIRHLLKKLKGKHTIILSTHILSEVQISCERVIIIDQGKIVGEDSISGLGKKISSQKRLILRVKDFSSKLESDLKSIDGVHQLQKSQREIILDVSGDSVNEDVAKSVVTGGFGLIEMKEEGFNLEDIFIKLVNKKEEVL